MILDLFSGPRGWSEGLAEHGRTDFGIEIDADACATAYAAGHASWQADVAALDPCSFAQLGVEGLIASPPCQAFSAAGKRRGVKDLRTIRDHIISCARGWRDLDHQCADARASLVLEPLRWAAALYPRWVVLEQVPMVLPLWRAYDVVLGGWGYSVWTGELNAADYGVPQTRQRAILIASLDRRVEPPRPTHARRPSSTRLPWVSMAEALGWTEEGLVGFARRDDRGDSPDGYRTRDRRATSEPAFALTEKARSWSLNTGRDWKPGGTRADAQTIPDDEPAPVFTAKAGGQWFFDRPATVICGDPRVFSPGGHIANDGRDNSKMIGRSENAVRIEIRDALLLQSFRPDYPVQGTRTAQFRQIGDAVPPRLAAAILGQVLRP